MARISQSRQLKLFLFSFFLAVGMGSIFPWWTVFVGFLSLLWWKRGVMPVVFGWLVGFCVIGASFPIFDPTDVGFYTDMNQKVVIEAVIVSDPEVRNNAQYVIVAAGKLDSFDVKGKILVKLRRYPQYKYGDVITLSGQLARPAEFETFSYADYLAKDGIFAVMYQPQVRLIRHQEGMFDGWSLVYWLKHEIRDEIEKLFGEPGASIVLGLLLGMRASIPQVLMDDFQRSGLTHILAISGYNITLLITIVGTLLKGLGRRVRFVATWFVIFLFALLTGLSASVVRASIMGALMVFVIFQGRKTDGMNILLLSGFLMILVSPRILIWDVSFQLSFVSTLGLMQLMLLFEPYVKKLPAFLGEGLLVTLAATIFTTPIVLYHFGVFSIISPLANVIFLPLIPLIMLFSFFALVSSFLWLPIVWFWLGVCSIFLMILIEGVHLVAQIPFALVTIPAFPWWAVGLYYLFLLKVIASRTPKLGRYSASRREGVS
ncbi:ComEC family competence protein [Candidatus Peregrinibacteria bacterium]|nr:ComEC family competence protein [Candidatus Peregrinibacteria bacterium]